MAGRVEGKVAFISGAARGQGRAHAVRLAEEGADIIAFDVAGPVPAQGAPAATPEDLAETIRLVEKLDRRIIATRADAREPEAVTALLADGVAQLGRLDIVVANAGIQGIPGSVAETSASDWQAVLDTNLSGVYNTVKPAIPHLIAGGGGGSITIISSSIALKLVPGLAPYGAAKSGLIGLMKTLALELAAHSIRVNSIHPTTVQTPMLINDVNFRLFRPDLDDPTLEDVEPVYRSLNALPVPWVEPSDIANALLFLASDEARYITGITLPVDAGYALK
ncbi:mycofactocin-coupled SDR family oxidoreductase [Modestobacter muralis]|uniref:Mycofactocin-coupled SDR family oxidoreductase n=1 Tax=Modestobacter muralis TaxID=1608614 RepID=A0A6P0H884_9ACTN|nr:mycofactocin-coupled SDR family oxidoreductase [Modestobacter muralis]NEK95210.1 mycofactocin-coupled SDR family oxidoreductase [Modestobacter muralis]NEN52098.1 mycofactocin-coupled SDR family oxidoreductase [Modestobacter muralis]